MGLTQTQLGRRIGYYQERISALERGTYGLPSLPALEELAHALECELTDLLCACGYIRAQTVQAPVQVGAPVSGSRLRDGVQQISRGMDDLQRRLSATESSMHQVELIRERMRTSRREMTEGIQECRKILS
jgi:transcriptional regulator with XRE-family HTH domain